MSSPIKAHTTTVIQNLIDEAKSLKSLEQKQLKGQLRELLVSKFLLKYLTNDFGIGSGIIINQKEEQSTQTDIIVYDKRIIPPFIKELNLGIFPAESVVATIEVKSWISKSDIIEYSEKVNYLLNNLYNPASCIYKDYVFMKPYCSIIGFYDNCKFKYDNTSDNRKIIENWINMNTTNLFGICLIGKFSWLRVMRQEGVVHLRSEFNDQTKAFFAILLDNIRTRAHMRYFRVLGRHSDWLSLYIRDQKLSKFFPDISID